MQYITNDMQVPVAGEYDVIVVGGGIAGVAASVAAARQNAKVLIIEKSVMLGGLATLGHICCYLPLCDGNGRKVTGGIAEELLHLSIRYGYNTLPPQWKEGILYADDATGRYQTMFNIPACVLAFDELLAQAGVDVLFDTLFCQPVMSDGVCEAIIVENKSGRSAYRCKMVVDASGDADVAYRAGAECSEELNMVSYVCYDTSFEQMSKAIETNNMEKAVGWCMLGCYPHFPREEIEKLGWYRGTTVEDVNKMVRAGRGVALEHLKENQRPDYTMLSVPGIPQWRKTRRINGVYALQPEDVHRRFDDSIGCVSDWRKAGPVFEIPYRSLIDPNLKNIITAGRIIASKDDAWEVTRVIPPCALTGEAAGIAAVQASEAGVPLQDIGIEMLQQTLEASGVIIHE